MARRSDLTDPVPAIEKKPIYVRFTPAVYEVLQASARAAKRSLGAEVELRIEEAMRRDGESA